MLDAKRYTFTLDELLEFAGQFGLERLPGDLILLSGPLGAGKTTFARGLLQGLGWKEPVRSPTFNLISLYPTNPPVLHADLYRLDPATGPGGLGLEDYLSDHIALIEWPDRLGATYDPETAYQIEIEFTDDPDLRIVTVHPPQTAISTTG